MMFSSDSVDFACNVIVTQLQMRVCSAIILRCSLRLTVPTAPRYLSAFISCSNMIFPYRYRITPYSSVNRCFRTWRLIVHYSCIGVSLRRKICRHVPSCRHVLLLWCNDCNDVTILLSFYDSHMIRLFYRFPRFILTEPEVSFCGARILTPKRSGKRNGRVISLHNMFMFRSGYFTCFGKKSKRALGVIPSARLLQN